MIFIPLLPVDRSRFLKLFRESLLLFVFLPLPSASVITTFEAYLPKSYDGSSLEISVGERNFYLIGMAFRIKNNLMANFSFLAESYLRSSTELVGLQVWRGAFFLADYVLENAGKFRNRNVLELAAGTGMLSVIVGSLRQRPKSVTITGVL